MKQPALSVIIVLYNMRREAKRSLHALSAKYQVGVTEADYDVHVVDNGSQDPVGEEFVRGFGANFHYYRLQDAPPSPACALNYAAARSRGRALALMIDGAHILTPRVLGYSLKLLSAKSCPVIAVRRFFLGPGQQPETIQSGYSQTVEDGLLARIEWPDAPDRLFEIGVFAGETRPGWFGRFWETNCLVMPRAVFEWMGGCDERFDLPAGGFLNLDVLARSVEYPGAELFALLGEGSFHQVHGGTTTNVSPTIADQRNDVFRQQYQQLRGRDYEVPTVPLDFFGALHPRSLLV